MENFIAPKPMLTAGQIICDKCKRCRHEKDGGDGYPADYCSAGHWDGLGEMNGDTEDNKKWDDCKDYLPCS